MNLFEAFKRSVEISVDDNIDEEIEKLWVLKFDIKDNPVKSNQIETIRDILPIPKDLSYTINYFPEDPHKLHIGFWVPRDTDV